MLRLRLTFPLHPDKAKRARENRSDREKYLPTGSESLFEWKSRYSRSDKEGLCD